MNKFLKAVVFTMLLVLSLQQVTFAAEKAQRPPKPTEGVESSDPKYGSSKDIIFFSPAISGLLTDWGCSISNPSGTTLNVAGSSTANTTVDQMTLTLYLQKWDGAQWADVNSWSYSSSSTTFINKGTNTTGQAGNYYRTRTVHTATKGTQTETQESTSSYIYVQ